MVAIPSVPSLDVEIVVDGKPARVYRSPDWNVCPLSRTSFHLPTGSKGSLPYKFRYIEAKPDKQFYVWLRTVPEFQQWSHHVAFEILVDGKLAAIVHQRKEDTTVNGVWWNSVHGPEKLTPGGDDVALHFQFAELEIVNSTRHLSARQRDLATHGGTVTVRCFHMNYCPPVPPTRSQEEYKTWGIPGLPEWARRDRTMDCVTRLVPSECAARRGPVLAMNYSDPGRRPFAIFEFRYRFRGTLIREGIMPPPTIADHVRDMYEHEVRQRLIQVLEEQERLEQELTIKEEFESTLPRIKRESSVHEDNESSVRRKARRLNTGGRVKAELADD
ncbi:hypothetical protein VTJ49DRAFT_2549 [Mycothermus thermophilus]|uniref:DUF7918 domain-containing protein n=1 Tax=Humicola insolens TaxID=85995 RepID=A0ABR3VA10_HUMIN